MDSNLRTIEDEIDLRQLILPLIAAWRLVLLLSVVGAVLAYAISFMIPPVYKADATLYVQAKSDIGSMLGGLPIPISTSSNSSSYYITLLQSRQLANTVMWKLHLVKDPLFTLGDRLSKQEAIERFQDNMSVTDLKTGTLGISVKAGSPQLAERIGNCALDTLDRMVVTASGRKANFTADKIRETTDELQKTENELRKFLEKNDIASVDYDTKAMIDGVRDIESWLVQNETELQQTESDLRNSGDLGSLANKEVQRRALDASRQYLLDKKTVLDQRISQVPELATEYARIERRLTVLAKTFEFLTQQYQMARITQQGENADYQIIDRAMGQEKPVSPRKALNAVAGGILGFLIAAVTVNTRSRRKRPRPLRRMTPDKAAV